MNDRTSSVILHDGVAMFSFLAVSALGMLPQHACVRKSEASASRSPMMARFIVAKGSG